jgi:hypothetical protein
MGMEGSLLPKYCAQSLTTYAAVGLFTRNGGSLSEGDIHALMTFLGEEVDGALTTHKIRGEATSR